MRQVKKTCYAQTSQIRLIRKKMVEIMTREASSCDLKELVGKFIPESIGASAAAAACRFIVGPILLIRVLRLRDRQN